MRDHLHIISTIVSGWSFNSLKSCIVLVKFLQPSFWVLIALLKYAKLHIPCYLVVCFHRVGFVLVAEGCPSIMWIKTCCLLQNCSWYSRQCQGKITPFKFPLL